MARTSHIKDPGEVLDFAWDWTDWLGADTIVTSTIAVETISGDTSALALDSESETTAVATAWLSAGSVPNNYLVTNEIITAGSRTARRSVEIQVRTL